MLIRLAARVLVGALSFGVLLGLAPDAHASSSFTDSVVSLSVSSLVDPALVMDPSGYPVVAGTKADGIPQLVLYRCNDANCEGGDESVVIVETAPVFSVPPYFLGTDIALDSSGNPVLAYFAYNELRLTGCGNAYCSAGNTIETVANTSHSPNLFGLSLALDAVDRPVLTFVSGTSLLLVHCNEASCSGGDESSVTLDSSANIQGSSPAVVLDGSGNPVVSYRSYLQTLNVTHCSDPDCSGSRSVTSPGTSPGSGSDIRLDGSGHPVISYISTGNALGILHCNDPDCAGGDDATSVPFSTVTPLSSLSLALDPGGYPIVAYARPSGANYKVQIVRCGDATCSSGNTLTSLGRVFGEAGLALDGAGNEVVVDGGVLTHCGSSHCTSNVDGDGCSDVLELATMPYSEFAGGRRDPKNPWDYFNPTHDGQNRIDDVLVVAQRYGKNTGDAAYSIEYDRTFLGPDPWDLGPPNGQIRVDDILLQTRQYNHDCF